MGPFGVFASLDNGSADWLAWQVVGRFQQNHGNRSGSKLLRFVKSDRYNKETDLNIKFWWDFIFPAVECQWFMLGNRYRPKKWHPRSGITGYQEILIQLFAGGRLLGQCSACYKYSKQQIFSISQCFQPILCKNLSSCLYKSWFDWKETLRLQIKDLSTTHKGSANKYPIFQVLISKSCCLSLGVLACCIAPGNLLYSDARLMRLLDEVGSQSLTLRSQCAEAGDWALTSVPPSSLHPRPLSVGNWHSGDGNSRGISVISDVTIIVIYWWDDS